MRIIESLGEFFQSLFDSGSNSEIILENYDEVRDAFAQFSGLNGKTLDYLSPESLKEILVKNESDWIYILLSANIFLAHSKICSIRGEGDAQFYLNKAVALLEMYNLSSPGDSYPEYLSDSKRFNIYSEAD